LLELEKEGFGAVVAFSETKDDDEESFEESNEDSDEDSNEKDELDGAMEVVMVFDKGVGDVFDVIDKIELVDVAAARTDVVLVDKG
jgi:hypothetical protein